ncbi:MAG: 4-phosphopantetheinyl transferase family protein, partial [Bacteroidetes bacterium]|nr:4-phosphopantetheinyl transferase family protein [Bacteroidota bacterium]
MIGLDLVYVNPLRNMPKRRLQLYAEKVCLGDDKHWVLNAEDPYLALGWLWSVKESAYKIWNRKVGKRSLNPRKFHISPSMTLPFLSKSTDTKIGQSMDE